MNIERKYTVTLEDNLSFQQYQIKMNAKKYPWHYLLRRLIVLYLPLFYIIHSSYFIYDFIVKMIGLIIALGFCIYYLIIFSFSKRFNKNRLKNIFYNKNDISENITIKITEESITDYSQYSEYKITPQWVHEYQENDDYIYLLNIYKTAIIIPKKHFSKDEIEMIKKYYGNVKGEKP
jgi:hypothetical protein